jgi:hypothetical protein
MLYVNKLLVNSPDSDRFSPQSKHKTQNTKNQTLNEFSSVIKVESFVKTVRSGLHFCSGEENQDGLKKISP